ncbi:MAG: hypothetical protein H8D26_07980 [Methanomicrobia archaeon]|nr:hypothetical protein [Methanomicrobia archaeon]
MPDKKKKVNPNAFHWKGYTKAEIEEYESQFLTEEEYKAKKKKKAKEKEKEAKKEAEKVKGY